MKKFEIIFTCSNLKSKTKTCCCLWMGFEVLWVILFFFFFTTNCKFSVPVGTETGRRSVALYNYSSWQKTDRQGVVWCVCLWVMIQFWWTVLWLKKNVPHVSVHVCLCLQQFDTCSLERFGRVKRKRCLGGADKNTETSDQPGSHYWQYLMHICLFQKYIYI